MPVGAPMPDAAERFAEPIAAVEAELGDHGRVLVRPSGTEPLVRVMVEAPTQDQADAAAESIAAAVRAIADRCRLCATRPAWPRGRVR